MCPAFLCQSEKFYMIELDPTVDNDGILGG